MDYLLIQLTILLVPGFLVVWLLKIRENRFIFSVSISYVIFVNLAILAKQLDWSIEDSLENP